MAGLRRKKKNGNIGRERDFLKGAHLCEEGKGWPTAQGKKTKLLFFVERKRGTLVPAGLKKSSRLRGAWIGKSRSLKLSAGAFYVGYHRGLTSKREVLGENTRKKER